MIAKLREAGFELEAVSFQNQIARFAWWLNSRVLKRQGLPIAQSRFFDRLVPFFRAIEGDRPPTGLSLIVVGRKGGSPSEAKAEEALAAAGAGS